MAIMYGTLSGLSKGSQDEDRFDELLKLLLHFLHSRRPWRSQRERSRKKASN
jgi:hypothetical protein